MNLINVQAISRVNSQENVMDRTCHSKLLGLSNTVPLSSSQQAILADMDMQDIQPYSSPHTSPTNRRASTFNSRIVEHVVNPEAFKLLKEKLLRTQALLCGVMNEHALLKDQLEATKTQLGESNHQMNVLAFRVNQLFSHAELCQRQIELHQADIKTQADRQTEVEKLSLKTQKRQYAYSNWGRKALHISICTNNLPALQELIQEGYNLRVAYKGQYPIHTASALGHESIVEYILEHDVNVNIRDVCGWSPLHYAVANNHMKSVEVLMHSGHKKNTQIPIDINIVNNNEETPLHRAVISGNLPMVKCLVLNKADIDLQTQFEYTVFHIAAAEGYVDILDYLYSTDTVSFSQSSYIDQPGLSKWTPLHVAVSTGAIKSVDWLLKYYADVNALTEDQENPLHLLIRLNQAETKFEFNETYCTGNSSLVQNKVTTRVVDPYFNKAECVLKLMRQGANINCANKKGETPLSLAIQYNETECIQLLRKHGALEIVEYNSQPV